MTSQNIGAQKNQNSDPNQIKQSTEFLGNRYRSLLFFLVLTLILSGVAIFSWLMLQIEFSISRGTNKLSDHSEPKKTQPDAPAEVSLEKELFQSRYILKNSNIMRVTDNQEEIFIAYIPQEIKEVRVGLEGKTLHFKIRGDLESEYKTCVEISTITKGLDYKSIPRGCRGYDGSSYMEAGGYLKNSNYFVYISLEESNYILNMENLTNQETTKIPISSQLFPTINEKTHLYPREDIRLANNKIILAFDRKLIIFNPSSSKVEGYYNLEEVVGNILTGSEMTPLIMQQLQYEGPKSLFAILDLSSDKLKVISLEDYRIGFYEDLYNIQQFEWTEDGVVINSPQTRFYSVKDLETLLGKTPSYYYSHPITSDKLKIKEEENNAEQYINSLNGYQKVVCVLDASQEGVGSPALGCYALIHVDTYKYKPRGELTKINF